MDGQQTLNGSCALTFQPDSNRLRKRQKAKQVDDSPLACARGRCGFSLGASLTLWAHRSPSGNWLARNGVDARETDFMAQIQFLGAAGTVTGSRYLVDTGKTRFLVDCGMFQGTKKLRLMNWEGLPLDAASVSSVFITHAHIDHIGMLPVMVRQGFRGPVWCTPSTLELCKLSLIDAAHLQEEDARFANKKGFSKHTPALPLYSVEEAERAIQHLQPVEYEREMNLDGEASIRFRDAGHILGSAMIVVRIGLRNQSTRLVFSGDLGRYNALILRDPTPIDASEYLLVESTYGNRQHAPEKSLQEVAEIINETARRGGILVIPAFAVGRTQTLLYVIRDLKEKQAIPDLPVYVDSPMAVNVSELFCKYVDEFDQEAQAIYRRTGRCPILFPNLHFVRTPAESQELNSLRFPSVIISASGMATGGRILHHLKHRLPDPRNTVLFTGFQSNGTRGQLLKDGAREIKIHGELVPVRAAIRSMESFSGHADTDEIMQWLQGFKSPPKRTFIVHGEPDSSAALAERIQQALHWKTHIPEYKEIVSLC
jgi:metallo-beta-lactamase family protein